MRRHMRPSPDDESKMKDHTHIRWFDALCRDVIIEVGHGNDPRSIPTVCRVFAMVSLEETGKLS